MTTFAPTAPTAPCAPCVAPTAPTAPCVAPCQLVKLAHSLINFINWAMGLSP